MAPKVIIINVWELHTIHPKAKLESLPMPEEIKTKETVYGKIPIPPLVMEIDKPPITNAGIKAFSPKLTVSGIEYFMILNIRRYIAQINIV